MEYNENWDPHDDLDEDDSFEEDFEEEPEFYTITQHMNIEKARKYIEYGGGDEDYYDPNNKESISEWAMAVALQSFKIGVKFTSKELENALAMAKLQQSLDHLVEEGLVDMIWDSDKNDFVYKAKKGME